MNKKLVNIETKRLTITNARKEDITIRYLDWVNDEYVMRYSNQRFTKKNFSSK